MNTRKKILALVLIMILAVLPAGSVFAASGTCGGSVTWDLTGSLMSIEGTGAMDDYTDSSRPGWFSDKPSIVTVSVSSGVTKIGSHTFSNCGNLTSVRTGNDVTTIGANAFSGCGSLTNVTLGRSVSAIDANAFSGCGSLVNIVFPDGVTSIGANAFANCSNLTSVTIPVSLTSIGAGAFTGCNITNVSYAGDASTWALISGKEALSGATVSYNVIEATGVTVSPTSLIMYVGETTPITATVSPANASDQTVTYSSNSNTIAEVDSNGIVTAKGVGNTTITVKDSKNHTATCNVTVKPVPVTGVALDKTSIYLTTSGTVTLTATVSPSNATYKSVTWTSSNPSAATVNNGTVTPLAVGQTTITVTTTDGSYTASCIINVIIPPTGVTLNKSALSLDVRRSETLTATVEPSNDVPVIWRSSNSSVATVNSSGTVTARTVGTAVITATTADGSKSSTCTVTVTNVSGLPNTEAEDHTRFHVSLLIILAGLTLCVWVCGRKKTDSSDM